MPENYDPQQPLLLRDSEICTYRICEVANSTIFSKRKANKRGRKKQNTELFIICSKCFSRITLEEVEGHHCRAEKSKRKKVDNVQNLLLHTPTTAQRIASRIIQGSTTPNTKTPMLSTLGPNPKRILSPSDQSEKRCDFTLESMTALQVDLSLSNRQTLRAAQHIRAATGSRKAVEKGFKPKMRANNKHLSDYFETKKCVFCYINKKNRKI